LEYQIRPSRQQNTKLRNINHSPTGSIYSNRKSWIKEAHSRKIDMNHKFEITNIQMKHNMEMNEMKCKLNFLEAKEKHTNCNMQTIFPRVQNIGHLEQVQPSIVHTHAHGQHNSQKYEMGTNTRNQDHMHKGYNRLDIYTEPHQFSTIKDIKTTIYNNSTGINQCKKANISK